MRGLRIRVGSIGSMSSDVMGLRLRSARGNLCVMNFLKLCMYIRARRGNGKNKDIK